jgi:hypothetical protein
MWELDTRADHFLTPHQQNATHTKEKIENKPVEIDETKSTTTSASKKITISAISAPSAPISESPLAISLARKPSETEVSGELLKEGDLDDDRLNIALQLADVRTTLFMSKEPPGSTVAHFHSIHHILYSNTFNVILSIDETGLVYVVRVILFPFFRLVDLFILYQLRYYY